jgi:DNA-binding protein HU-beta
MPTPKTLEKTKTDVAADITSMFKAGTEVHIPGLGKFEVIDKPARTGRNPSTGAAVQIPAKKAIRYVPAKSLKEAINA